MIPPKVQYVDDEEPSRRLAARFLGSYNPEIVDNIVDAYNRVSEDPDAYAIIFIDKDQPTKGSLKERPSEEMGLELLERLQTLYKGREKVPDRWIVTAKPYPGLEARVLALGGKGVITKPIDVWRIRQKTDEALAGYPPL